MTRFIQGMKDKTTGRTLLMSVLAVFLGVILFAILFLWLHTERNQRAEVELDRYANTVQLSIDSAFEQLLDSLIAVAGYLEVSSSVDIDSYMGFVGRRDHQLIQLSSVDWLPKTRMKDLTELTRQAHAQGLTTFQFQDNSRISALAEKFPVLYSYPEQNKSKVLGKDFAGFQPISTVVKSLAEKGKPRLYFIPKGQQWALLMPVYQEGEFGYAGLKGVLLARFEVKNWLAHNLSQMLDKVPGLSVRIEDLRLKPSDIYSNSVDAFVVEHRMQAERHFAGRHWVFYYGLVPQKTLYASLMSPIAVSGILTLLYAIGAFWGISLRRKAMLTAKALAQRESNLEFVKIQYDHLFQRAQEGFVRAELNGNVLSANPAFLAIFGYFQPHNLNVSRDCYINPLDYVKFVQELRAHGQVINFEWQGRDRLGKPLWIRESAYLVESNPQGLMYDAIVEDVSARKASDEKLYFQANHDLLTGALNRSRFTRELDSFIVQHCHHEQWQGLLLYLDMDNFKQVNDEIGHAAGDTLLISFYKRARRLLGESVSIARLGGDEFAILVPGETTPQKADETLELLFSLQEHPFDLGARHKFQLSMSVGVVPLNKEYVSSELVMQHADMAMYEAKRGGKSAWHYCDKALLAEAKHKSGLASALATALKHNELYLVYQPIYLLETGQVNGYEVLLRWYHEEFGQVEPSEFVPLLEESGQIKAVGVWVLETAIAELARMQQYHPSPLCMHINLSPKQLRRKGLCEIVSQSLSKTRLNPGQVHLELTETDIVSNEEEIIAQLEALKALGLKIYIDDFGTGHSSLKRLTDYPVDGVKIDRSFIIKLMDSYQNQAVTQSVVQMASVLGLAVIAEGIEKQEQADWLLENGCLQGQGYFLGQPETFPYANAKAKEREQQM